MRSSVSTCMLLWMLTASVCHAFVSGTEITVRSFSDEIVPSCSNGSQMFSPSGETVKRVDFRDESTGEYSCEPIHKDDDPPKLYIKFQTCDNCVQLDLPSKIGLTIGNLLVTIGIGVAVYLIASHSRVSGPTKAHRKNSADRRPLVSSEGGNRTPNDTYQELYLKDVQKEPYDVLRTNRK